MRILFLGIWTKRHTEMSSQWQVFVVKDQERLGRGQASQRHVDAKIPRGSVSGEASWEEGEWTTPQKWTDGPAAAWNSMLPEAWMFSISCVSMRPLCSYTYMFLPHLIARLLGIHLYKSSLVTRNITMADGEAVEKYPSFLIPWLKYPWGIFYTISQSSQSLEFWLPTLATSLIVHLLLASLHYQCFLGSPSK